MEVKIDKEKAWKTIKTGMIIYGAIILVIGLGCLNLIKKFLEIDSKGITLWYFVGFIIVWLIITLYKWLWLRSVVYDAEPDKLTETYSIITKTRNQARLQVVNDVNITQSIIQKFFGKLFNVGVTYGFGDEGYNFVYKYLSEEEANRISDFIKVKSRMVSIK